VYALTVPDLDGRPVPLEQYRAAFPVLLIVNVASK
jgi:glutathione peroxidase-family protein